MNRCIAQEQFRRLLAEQLSPAERQALDAHVDGCGPCQEALVRLLDAGAPMQDTPEEDWQLLRGGGPAATAEFPDHLRHRLQGALPDSASTASGAGPAADILFPGPPTHLGPLGQIESYHIVVEIGRGAFGLVFKAYDEKLDRLVALKVLRPELAAGACDRARFEGEARKAATVRHDHVVAIHRVGSTPGFALPYFVMEYIDGEALSDRLERQGALGPREAAAVVRQAALGLAAAHARGLVHRDVKPSNILLERAGGRAKVSDFGLARALEVRSEKLTQSGGIVGTPPYMSPEQILAPQRIDQRSDIYGLGAVLYEALTGGPPFRGLTHLVFQQVVHEEPRPPRRLNDAVPRDLETICLHCLHKEPGKRYADAAALAEDLRRFLAGEPIRARPVGAWERAVKWTRRRPAIAALLALVLVVTALGFGLVTWHWRQAEAERQMAEVARRGEAGKAAELRIQNYTRNIALAASELSSGNIARAEELLDDCPETLRGWEWRYLKRLSQAPPVTLDLGERLGIGHAADLAFSPSDGRLLAAPSGPRGITIWDVSTGRAVRTLTGHEARVLRLTFSPDGRYLASGSEDKTVKVWDVATGRELCTCPHDGRVHGLAFSPRGQYLASTGEDNRVKVWETSKLLGATRIAAPLRNFPARFIRKRLVNVAFSPDGRFLASGGEEKTVKVWDVTTGRAAYTLRGHTEPVYCVAFSADGRLLASKGWDALVIVWDLATGRPAFPPLVRGGGSSGWTMAFSPDGRRLAMGGDHRDGTIFLYDTRTGQIAHTLNGHTERIACVAFSPDGRRLASASFDKTVRLWDTERGEELLALRGHTDLVGCVRFDPHGKRLASSGEDGKVRIWDGTPLGVDLEHVQTLRTDTGIVYGVAFSRDSRWLASAGGQVGQPGAVKVWDVAAGREVFTLRGHTNQVFGVAFGPEDLLATAGADRTVKFWNTRTRQEVRALTGLSGAIHCMALSHDGRRLATCDAYQTVQLWDLATDRHGPLTGHRGFIWSVAFSPDGKFVATSGVDGTVRLWNAATGEKVRTSPEQNTRVLAVVFSPDGKLLASADADGKVILWDAAAGTVRHTLPGDGEYVLGLAFSPDGRRLAAASWKEVKIWDLTQRQETPQKLGGLAGTINGLAFSPDGQRLAACGGYKGKGEIKIWDRALWDRPAHP